MLRGEKTIDVIAMGDLILNFAYAGESSEGIALYERQPAGATANMLTQVARLGGRAALISVLGNDEHSRYLFDYEKQCGVDMTNVRLGDLPTRIMFVYYDENNSEFSSYTEFIEKYTTGDNKFKYDIMVHLPEMYYRVIDDSVESRRYYYVSATEFENSKKHPGSNTYVSRYNMTNKYAEIDHQNMFHHILYSSHSLCCN